MIGHKNLVRKIEKALESFKNIDTTALCNNDFPAEAFKKEVLNNDKVMDSEYLNLVAKYLIMPCRYLAIGEMVVRELFENDLTFKECVEIISGLFGIVKK